MTQAIFNGYRIMWLFVFFDLPTNTKIERKLASGFRKSLLQDGFSMMQFSVYIRHCPSRESATTHEQRIRKLVPKKGKVSIIHITDKQYGNIINIWGKESTPPLDTPRQLTLF